MEVFVEKRCLKGEVTLYISTYFVSHSFVRLEERGARGPFLESPGNFSGPKSNIQIEI